MSLEPEKTYIGYEYKEISVPNKDVSLFLDCYENFGWTAEEPRPIQSGKGTVTLHLKRNRKIINKMELTRLQRNFESSMQEIQQMERSKKQTAMVWALLTGLAGTAFMAGAVFAVTSEPPHYLLTILLAIPAFAGWILPSFFYRHQLQRQSRKVQPFIEAKYDEIYQLCEKGHSLL